MKIIVPMAGIGSRLRPHSLTTPKPLTVIAGKPIVQRLVEDITAVVNQPIDEIAFIIGSTAKGFPSDTKDKLIAIAKSLGAKGSVFVQEEALGTAHAIYCAKEALNGSCVVAFADTLFKADFTLDANADGAIWVKQVEDPSAFGVVKLNDGFITDFVEKPKEFVSDLAIIGIYYFKDGDKLREEIKHLIDNDIRPSGEFQLTEVLESLKQQGAKFIPGKVDAWMDCGKKDPTVDTNKQVLGFEQADGNNLVSDDVILENSEIIQPCYVGKNVILKNTKIGPYVSIGENSIVENSTIENSLIQTNVRIQNATLDNAMIGNHAKYNANYTSVSIGDYTDLT
ncbi:sugar phosphate nucleotidyltransferase [Tenacibaculum finnmarkense]|uniref:Nucleotidyltransferase n=1 Tax=Tenacibaculum finnmarkense genomovar ulcerans TaxID=2781388 RepID=A0A2I2LD14_9FLAO|nr:sugar phosphate nucleotidyltransferase [Tenacibaculum finnmarkense]MBE7645259.1 nucleotidyltransferase [Tenacibaculum finnmarkense genomovar ulcerans]MBE7696744.1 nucleotidyltransferase [Tenacibaculum finnmarkense genomovar ulcerans]MCD8431943.1 nucleotidyltransferase [Tenacibaculum finnmarkense genomovar ulcerans]MCG8237526.1 nucleotidyltransferase [Tenacibaculum finnmarkense genomovar ulcerans]MCG8733251.1 nucleotidyltransferase [Tenacibaculum finnmarkense]